MISKRFLLVVQVCALVVGLQLASYANTIQLAEASGGISEDGVNKMAVYVLAEKTTFTNPATAPQVGGQICLAGHTGNLALTANACPLSATFCSAVVSGVTYDYATVTTKPFSCLDLTTGVSTEAWMTICMTTGPGGLYELGFQIFSEANNSLLAETVCPATGASAELKLSYGSELIDLL